MRLHGDGAGESGPARLGWAVRGPRRGSVTPALYGGDPPRGAAAAWGLSPRRRSAGTRRFPRCRAGVTARGTRCPCAGLHLHDWARPRLWGCRSGQREREAAGPALSEAAGGCPRLGRCLRLGWCLPLPRRCPRLGDGPLSPSLGLGVQAVPGSPSLLCPVSKR